SAGLLGRSAGPGAKDVQARRRAAAAVRRAWRAALAGSDRVLSGRDARVGRSVRAAPDRLRQAAELSRRVGRVGESGRSADRDEEVGARSLLAASLFKTLEEARVVPLRRVGPIRNLYR